MSIKNRGFGSMAKGKQRAIASLGGKAAHAKGSAHQWTSASAREAGRKGGRASHKNRVEATEEAALRQSETEDLSGA